MSDECIFCKIIKNEIPSSKIYEDDDVYAFLDIAPINPGHALVIPKKHFNNFTDISDEYLCKVIVSAKKISRAIQKTIKMEDFNVSLNNGRVAGQTVPHAHFHIIPRNKGDNFKHWPHKEYKNGEAEEIAEKIRKNI